MAVPTGGALANENNDLSCPTPENRTIDNITGSSGLSNLDEPEKESPGANATGADGSAKTQCKSIYDLSKTNISEDPEQLLKAALSYAERGWHVFPLWPDKKTPLGGAGQNDATADLEQIRRWWAETPGANIGLNLKASGLLALDPDTYKEDCEWDAFIADRDLPETLVQTSARGGKHYIFKAPDGAAFKGKLCDGVDIKHDGYIVLAPSTFEGKPYRLNNDLPPADVPDWVPRKGDRVPYEAPVRAQPVSVEAHTRHEARAREHLREIAAKLEATGDGGRNNALNACALEAGHRVGAGYLTEAEVEDALRTACMANGYLQEDGEEAFLATFKSGLKAGLSEPWFYEDYRSAFSVVRLPGPDDLFYKASDFAGQVVPPREWLVRDLIPLSDLTLFSGDGGTGKSLLALQLAVAVVTGGGWIGHEAAEGKALVLSAEDDDAELHRRLDGISQAERTSLATLHRLSLRSLAGKDALLAVEGGKGSKLLKTALFEALDAHVAREKPQLVVIDTLANVYPGNENDRSQVAQFTGILRGLAIKHRCAVLLLAHPSQDGLRTGSGMSGSTAWNNSVRSRVYLQRNISDGHEPDPDARTLVTKKANYGRTGAETALRWRNGVFVPVTMALPGSATETPEQKAERVFLKLLTEQTQLGITYNANAGSRYAPTQFVTLEGSEGLSKAAFKGAMDRLLRSGGVVNEQTGPASRRSTFLKLGVK